MKQAMTKLMKLSRRVSCCCCAHHFAQNVPVMYSITHKGDFHEQMTYLLLLNNVVLNSAILPL